MTDNAEWLRIQMVTPKLADAAVRFAATGGQDLMTVLSQVAKIAIPQGLRVGFVQSALRHLKDSRKISPIYVHDPDTLEFRETITGEVYWKEAR